jgi:ligand-binding sensor domain-containing protein
VHTYNASAGLRLDQINQIVIDDANRAWVANGSYLQGGLNVVAVGDSVEALSDDQMTTFTAQNSGLPGNYVTAVALGKNNDVWLGTNLGAAHLHYGTSPFVKQDDQWTAYTPQTSGIADQHIRDIAVDSTGNVWFALATGGVSLYTTGGEWVTFREADGLLLDEVNVVAVDQAGQLWFGTDGEGISVLDHKGTLTDKSDDSWTAYQPGAPLLSGYIQTITVDGWGQVWVGAFGGGLSVYSTVTFQQLHLPIIRQPYQ